jgi:hypothetical protein
MWVLLSTAARRWLIASIALPLAAKAVAMVAGRLERRNGPTRLSKVLRRTSSLTSARRGGNRTPTAHSIAARQHS